MTDDQLPENDDGYKVGYGRPPKHSRFQKGRSGNPSGASSKPEKSVRQKLSDILNRPALTPSGKKVPYGDLLLEQAVMGLFSKEARAVASATAKIKFLEQFASVPNRRVTLKDIERFKSLLVPDDEKSDPGET